MSLLKEIKSRRIYLDGSMGTMLQSLGLQPGELPERWNISHKHDIINIHRSYFEAGSNIVCTNTFGANSLKFDDEELEEIIKNAVENVDIALKTANPYVKKYKVKSRYKALDIGPLGKLLKPYGDLGFEDAVEIFAKTVRLGVKYGVDLIFIETMNDCYETKAAVLAAKENSSLPVFVSNAYGEDGKLMTGADPVAMVSMLEGLGVDAIGVNCSLGPKQLIGVAKELVKYSSLPVFAKPNAGLPSSENGKTVFLVDSKQFAEEMAEMAKQGVNILGGCCGTTPEYIKATVEKTADLLPSKITEKHFTLISSYTHALKIGEKPLLIGERINPTGKKRFKQALIENDMDYILKEGLNQQEKGSHILDVNVGLPDIDETEMLCKTVFELQAVTNLPLQIDTSNIKAMEKTLRVYNGKALINSVNGKKECMEAVFPLVKKYGGVCVALTLDENGIPSSADGRIAIAENILKTAKKYGISKKDIVFDTLCMSVSADSNGALATLGALKHIHNKMKMNTVLGVSNISFGLPERDIINASFFNMALEEGLSLAIINPYSNEIMKTYYTFRLLHNMDENCLEYINFASSLPKITETKTDVISAKALSGETELQNSIIKGLKELASELCEKELSAGKAPLDIVNNQIIPALDVVGKGFENKTIYLPQLLMSAEAAKNAFEKVNDAISKSGEKRAKKAKFVIATVKGDIHDIGKNIVKVLLENYGFQVFDLGKDVPPEKIAEVVKREHAPLCGLSALMTTTVPFMEETIKLLRKEAPYCKIVVGGAVLNYDYAMRIGADKYAADAMESVRYAEQIIGNK